MISVIVPIYNASLYLKECIDSILLQDYKDIEVILINDGSIDCSLEICKSYTDSRIVIVDKENGGVSSARNYGMRVAKGSYLTFVDSDDILPPDALSSLMRNMLWYDSDIAVGSFMFIYGNILQPHSSRLQKGLYQCDSLYSTFIDDGTLSGFLVGSVWGTLYKTDIIHRNQLIFQEKIKNNEDGLFNFEYVLKAKYLSVTDKCTYYYRQYENSSTSKRDINYNFNKLIKHYITDNVEIPLCYQIDSQFDKRNVTVVLWDILSYVPRVNVTDGVKYIHHQLSSPEVINGLRMLNVSAMRLHKKIFYWLMKLRCSILLYVSVKYIIPIFRAKISR